MVDRKLSLFPILLVGKIYGFSPPVPPCQGSGWKLRIIFYLHRLYNLLLGSLFFYIFYCTLRFVDLRIFENSSFDMANRYLMVANFVCSLVFTFVLLIFIVIFLVKPIKISNFILLTHKIDEIFQKLSYVRVNFKKQFWINVVVLVFTPSYLLVCLKFQLLYFMVLKVISC